MKKKPTIIDVAREAGVSKSTVSLVLQHSPLVKEKTRKQIREAMERIGYIYNRSAANLRSSSIDLIGLVINDLRNPFFTEFAALLQKNLSEHGYAVVLSNVNEDAALQAQTINALIEHGVSGFVIAAAYGDDSDTSLRLIAKAEIPAIQVFRKVDDREDKIPFVAPDYQLGGRLATEHLFMRGCKRIAFLGGLDDRTVTEDRMSGYLSVLEERGEPPLLLTGSATHQFGVEGAKRLKVDHPDVEGVLCFNDRVALGAINGCSMVGRQVGSDLRIVGFDNIEGCEQSVPKLTSVSCGMIDFVSCVSDGLLAWLSNPIKPMPSIRTPVELIIRGSS